MAAIGTCRAGLNDVLHVIAQLVSEFPDAARLPTDEQEAAIPA